MPVNTGHAIGAKARFVFYKPESQNELLTGTVPAAGGSNSSTSIGMGWIAPDNYTGNWTMNVPTIDTKNNDVTIFWKGEVWANVEAIIASYTASGFGWIMRFKGWASNQSLLTFEGQWQGQAKGNVVNQINGSIHSAAIRINIASSTIDVFHDGVFQASQWCPLDPTAVSNPGSILLWNQSTSTPQKTVHLQIYEGALTNTEIGDLHTDPTIIMLQPPVLGALSVTEADDTVVATGSLFTVGPVVASLAVTEADDTLAATGKIAIKGSANIFEEDDILASGEFDPYARLKAILLTTPLHTWVKVNTNSFDDVEPGSSDRAVDPGNHRAIITAWSSFAFDHDNANIVLYGGGHANYIGNELYIWNGSTGEWELASLPSKVDEADAGKYIISKDAPQSSHTYANNAWLPNNKMFLTFGGAAASSGSTFEEIVTDSPRVTRKVGPWVFDLSLADPEKIGGGNGTGYDITRLGSSAWQHRRDKVTGYDIPAQNHVTGATIVVDQSGTDVAYFTMGVGGFPNFYRYTFGDLRNPASTDHVEMISRSWTGITTDGFGVYDSKRQMFYRNAGQNGGTVAPSGGYTCDLVALHLPTAAGWATQTTGIELVDSNGIAAPICGPNWPATFYGCCYDSDNDRLWLWDSGIGSPSVPGRVKYINIPPATGAAWSTTVWTIETLDPVGSVPHGMHNAGVMGKMHYVTELGAFIVIDGANLGDDDPGVWLFKTTVKISPEQPITVQSLIGDSSISTGQITVAGDLFVEMLLQASSITDGEVAINGNQVVAEELIFSPTISSGGIVSRLHPHWLTDAPITNDWT